jgi:hypothetical protein
MKETDSSKLLFYVTFKIFYIVEYEYDSIQGYSIV